eukprot:9012373-Prorocentrum_lima.AAC.1
MGWFKAAKDFLPHWTRTLFRTEFLALETDMVGDKKFINIAVDPAAMKAAMETKTTSVSAVSYTHLRAHETR